MYLQLYLHSVPMAELHDKNVSLRSFRDTRYMVKPGLYSRKEKIYEKINEKNGIYVRSSLYTSVTSMHMQSRT
jgi:hypothetical protein